MSEFKMPTEIVELPSQGLVYPSDNPLSKGKVEIKYMTAKEEDILTNQSYITKGIVLDKLMESVLISEIDVDDLIVGDKNAILIATRLLGYGKKYKISINGEEEEIDLSLLENKPLQEDLITKGKNEFSFTLPHSENEITFKILTGKDEKKISQELKGLKRINKNNIPELSTRLKYIITSVNGDDDFKHIRKFVETALLARDSRALREYIKEIQPDVDLNYELENGDIVEVPIGIKFFWPDM